jgi:large subunit ribosomal protein L2
MQDYNIFLKVSTRHSLVIKSPTSKTIQRKLLYYRTSMAGRNSQGRICVRHKGGGSKKLHRYVDFNRDLYSTLVVIQLERCPVATRTAFIALVSYPFGILSYIIAPEGVKKGDVLRNYSHSETRRNVLLKLGFSALLRSMRPGLAIYDVEKDPGFGGTFAKAAGTSCLLKFIDYDNLVALIQLPSKRFYKVSVNARGVYGRSSNGYHKRQIMGTAGRNRRAGIRPTVRGVAMNPVDHPHGGGEGKRASGRPSVSPWGKLTKGKPTVSSKRKRLVARRLSIFKQYINN